MSLDLPSLVRPGVFLLLSFRAAEKLFSPVFFAPFSKVGNSELYSTSSAYPSFHGTSIRLMGLNLYDATESLLVARSFTAKLARARHWYSRY